MEVVKKEFYKREVNREIYIRYIKGTLGIREELRSSADLSIKEMQISIERFKNWSADAAGIILPDEGDKRRLAWVENEIEREKVYL